MHIWLKGKKNFLCYFYCVLGSFFTGERCHNKISTKAGPGAAPLQNRCRECSFNGGTKTDQDQEQDGTLSLIVTEDLLYLHSICSVSSLHIPDHLVAARLQLGFSYTGQERHRLKSTIMTGERIVGAKLPWFVLLQSHEMGSKHHCWPITPQAQPFFIYSLW